MTEKEGLENIASFDADKYIKSFEEDVGCKITTIASTLHSQSHELKDKNWRTFSKDKCELTTFVEIYTIVMCVVAYTLKKKQISKKPSKNSIKALTIKLLSKLPKSNNNKPILTKSEYMTNFDRLLNEIYDSTQQNIVKLAEGVDQNNKIATQQQIQSDHTLEQTTNPSPPKHVFMVIEKHVQPEFQTKADFVEEALKKSDCDACKCATMFFWFCNLAICSFILLLGIIMYIEWSSSSDGRGMASIFIWPSVIDVCVFMLIIVGIYKSNLTCSVFGVIWAAIHGCLWLVITNWIYCNKINEAEMEYDRIYANVRVVNVIANNNNPIGEQQKE
eukprot:176913_1